jgi:hypothetical protein
MAFYTLHFIPVGSTGAYITATNTGDNQNYLLSQLPTSPNYTAIMNNGIYTVDDTNFPFTVSGLTMTFASPLPADLAGTIIRLQCI